MTAPKTDPDAELIARLQRGDEGAFRAIWDAYHGRLIEFVYRYVRSYDVAADVVQHVFFVLWRDRETYTPRPTLVSHLYGAARFRALHELRHARVERAYEVATAATNDADPQFSWNAGEYAAERDELQRAVRRAFERMTPRVREIFLLHRNDALTAPQIAATLGIAVQVVYNQLSKALKIVAEETAGVRE